MFPKITLKDLGYIALKVDLPKPSNDHYTPNAFFLCCKNAKSNFIYLFSLTSWERCRPTRRRWAFQLNVRFGFFACTRLAGPMSSSFNGTNRPRLFYSSSESQDGQRASTATSQQVKELNYF